MFWQELVKLLGGVTIFAAAIAWLSKSIITHYLNRDIEAFKNHLSTESVALVEILKNQLSTESVALVETLKSQLATESGLFIEAFKSQLATGSTLLVEEFKSKLATESAALLEAYKTRLNKDLEEHKSQLQKDLQFTAQVALSRLPAYQRLWALMEIASPSMKADLTDQQKQEFSTSLTSWYYKEGNGIFLSVQAGDLFLKAKACLSGGSNVTNDMIRTAFSDLRTQMKTDISVYGPGEARIQIGI